MKPMFHTKPVCMNCDKVLEPEFVEAHKALGHKVEDFVFGGYTDRPPAEKKEEKVSEGEVPF